MTEETDDPLSDGIARALGAASAANDAAQDLDLLQAEHRAFMERMIRGQKRMQALCLGALAGAGVAVLLGGLVYFRSVADLRDASAIQAQAGELMVTRLTELGEAIGKVEGLADRIEAQEATLKTAIEAVGDRVAGDLETYAADAGAMGPQFATAIQSHVDEGLAATREALVTALGEVDVSLRRAIESGAGASPEIRALIGEIRAERAPARKPAAKAPSRPAKAAPRPAPKAADNPIRYP
ncbi:hypothetical protein GQF56_06855 [Rhodobacter sphaeroides]|uniref:Uncharacterized protein n=1 Tax=Cereibacter sphaeroides (strain ATCC 17023 / DSM 158 / JCM 6121 / CCUG 31486 / LMG 2827 / NBRC 12203 / NCIMB 8253 / ATH 2.4.1.) TaxID=272943 RepID=Q3J1U3_CERS4|nr:hypothetical protein [Cereibacter sphaeroides]ABA79241.1 hypothetical protein RSP_0067 [Cereibacter sphaeroides 2.4.1]AXC61455.1 hypothetical protein DQL45_08775 [Cereibacter sphaeroides 2.4.1]EGJ21521.1 hypothetical protein RSWS8N_05545 [Cereibacter sphaeroides WS8N]MVX47589.1 hypothetical protein [Cereibacter sphaeroides]QHA13523.1 hypothetical protein GQY06_08760 [Cereibacter sphaeroides]